MFEGLKYSREASYNSKRNPNHSLKDESTRAANTNTMGERNNDQTVINPSPSMKSGSKKYGLSRQPDSWAKRIANNIEADKAAAKHLGEKNSPAAASFNSAGRNIDVLAIAQDVIDARTLLCRVSYQLYHITHFITSPTLSHHQLYHLT